MNEIVIDIPLEATMTEAVEIFKTQLPLLNLTVDVLDTDAPTIKMRIAHTQVGAEVKKD